MNLYKDIDLNIQYYEGLFSNCGDLVKRKIPVGQNKELFIYVSYIDMLVNNEDLEKIILSKLMSDRINLHRITSKTVYDVLKDYGMSTADLKDCDNFEDITTGVLSGDTVIFVDGFTKAVVISTKGFPNRGIPETKTEIVVQGSKEAFSEVFRFNTALIRRRIRDTNLKVHQMRVGRSSKTDIAFMYLDGIVRPQVLKEALERANNIDIDAILDSGYMEQLMEDDWKSPFPQMQMTERPDKAASAILEGRIAIVVDNSPFVIMIPATLNTFFQSSEDYYQRFEIMTFTRILRYFAAFLAVALPGLYVALAVFHPAMIPTILTFRMAESRIMVPFPLVIEVILMELAFELLREAGIRLPNAVGSSIGIIGGIVVGQAAVEAGIVSPVVVIIVALTGIASFTIPNYSLVSGFRLCKYLIIALSAILGLFGFWMAAIIILIHLVSLKSFGIPYLFPYASGEINGYSDFKDSIIRFPLFMMRKRPFFANPENKNRLNEKMSGNKRNKE